MNGEQRSGLKRKKTYRTNVRQEVNIYFFYSVFISLGNPVAEFGISRFACTHDRLRRDETRAFYILYFRTAANAFFRSRSSDRRAYTQTYKTVMFIVGHEFIRRLQYAGQVNVGNGDCFSFFFETSNRNENVQLEKNIRSRWTTKPVTTIIRTYYNIDTSFQRRFARKLPSRTTSTV